MQGSLPWSGRRPPYGFSPDGVATWLPQPADWADLCVARQVVDQTSMLSLHRTLIHLRHEENALQGTDFHWLDAPDGVLAFVRGDLMCAVNFSSPVPLPDAAEVLVSSEPTNDRRLPTDTAVIARIPNGTECWKEVTHI